LNEDSAWNFTATANPYSIYSTGVAIGVVSAKWHRAWEIFRLGVGINTFVGDIAIPVSDEAGETIDELKLPFIPLPALSFAWRI
jgi:hypothetical protein